MRTKLKICVEARYLILSRGYREQDAVIVDPFDEMKRTTIMVRMLIASGIVVLGDVNALLSGCVMSDGAWVMADGASERFDRCVRERFHAWSSISQERSIFETVVPSIRQLCFEDAVASSIEMMHADREVFQRHKRGGHPRYASLAARLFTHYQRVFFGIYGERALDHVNLEIAGWKRAIRWYRLGGVERDREMGFAPAYSGLAGLSDGEARDDGSGADE